jgi:hypothetical protein
LEAAGRRICSTDIHPDNLTAFVACRLIPLDKHPLLKQGSTSPQKEMSPWCCSFIEEFVSRKVVGWSQELTDIVQTQHHAAYIHGLSSRWTFLSRTIPDITPTPCVCRAALSVHSVSRLLYTIGFGLISSWLSFKGFRGLPRGCLSLRISWVVWRWISSRPRTSC